VEKIENVLPEKETSHIVYKKQKRARRKKVEEI
jgi:hypothetical protein